jgi:hypothetical protein
MQKLLQGQQPCPLLAYIGTCSSPVVCILSDLLCASVHLPQGAHQLDLLHIVWEAGIYSVVVCARRFIAAVLRQFSFNLTNATRKAVLCDRDEPSK